MTKNNRAGDVRKAERSARGRRDLVLQALNHRDAGQVPVDFGSTAITGMHVSCVAALRERYGLERRPVKVHEPYQMLGLMEDDLLDALGVDTVGLLPLGTLFGVPPRDWKAWRTPWGQEVLIPGKLAFTTRGGDTFVHPQGDVSAPPSGRMPEGGYFFDSIVRQPPIEEDKLDPRDNLEEFAPLSDEDLAILAREAEAASATGRAVVGGIGGTAFGDIAMVPAPFLRQPKGIRDIAEWYMATAARPDYVHAVFSAQCEIALENLRRLHAAVGEKLDVLVVCGTDFGTQTSSFCSIATFEHLYAPYYRKVNDWVHRHTSWRTFKHSCGAIANFIPQFIEAGFDILNPVQCSAVGMAPEELKRRYGERMVFWGGGVDTQKTLPFGTPEQVRREVLERCRIFSRQGGFVFNAIHNVQARTPVDNIAAMFAALREFNGV
ncbi:MAG: uroporphyrinogen decarboxylase family protein [Kiritimatiellae bacterium]|nr:uroporphyrinogen decarboxylase family protein [Kiritimatiellia bacterium]